MIITLLALLVLFMGGGVVFVVVELKIVKGDAVYWKKKFEEQRDGHIAVLVGSLGKPAVNNGVELGEIVLLKGGRSGDL